MEPWTLFEVVLAGEDKGVVSIWKDGVSRKVWITFTTRWREMIKLHQAQWPPSWATPLVGYEGILEMRLKVSQHQYRSLFIFGPTRRSIVFLVMADEVGDDWVPKDAPERAKTLQGQVMNHKGRIDELDLDK